MRRWRFGLLCGLWLVLVAGCGDDQDLCPALPVGVIEGTMTSGGVPLRGGVQCIPVGPDDVPGGSIGALSDSSGRYSITVPVGDYLLRVQWPSIYWTSHGLVWGQAEAETVHVGSERVRADFRGGALTLRLSVPPEATATRFISELRDASTGTRRQLGNGGAVVDGLATLSWPLLPAGAYALRMGDDLNRMIWLPPSFDPGDAESIAIDATESVTRDYALPTPAVADVRVHGSWQSIGLSDPYDRPTVEFFSPDSVGYWGGAVLADGSCRVELFAPAEMRMCVTIGSIRRWLGGWTFAEAQPIDLAPGDPPRAIDYEESGVAVTLEGPGFESDHEAVYHIFDPNGRQVAQGGGAFGERPAWLPNLAAGTYTLFVARFSRGQAWAAQWYDRVDSMSAATPIVVPADGAMVPITVRLEMGGRILGRVHWTDGEPYLGWVRLRSVDGAYDDETATATHTGTGEFVLSGLSDGEYLLGVPRVTRTLWHPGTWDMSEAQVIRIVDHGTVEGIDLWIPK